MPLSTYASHYARLHIKCSLNMCHIIYEPLVRSFSFVEEVHLLLLPLTCLKQVSPGYVSFCHVVVKIFCPVSVANLLVRVMMMMCFNQTFELSLKQMNTKKR